MTDQTPPDGAGSVRADQPDWDALARYLAGEGTAREADSVHQWLAAHPDGAAMLEALDQGIRRAGDGSTSRLDTETALRSVHERMRHRMRQSPFRVALRKTVRPAFVWRGAALAAAAVVVAAVGVTLWLRNGRGAYSSSTVIDSAPRVLATEIGVRDSVRLADGTRVILGPRSRLTVAAGFAQGQREVVLEGDGFFDVMHDAAHPFSVRVLGTRISDVGTAFTVHGDRGDGVAVSVESGAVELSDSVAGRAGVVLRTGDLGGVSIGGEIAVQRGGATPADLAWTEGRLVFRDAPVGKVRADLRRWYGVELVVVDSALERRHVTASFLGDSREQVLRVISLALGARYELRGDTVRLHSASAPARAAK
jgi:transmembrane sensor